MKTDVALDLHNVDPALDLLHHHQKQIDPYELDLRHGSRNKKKLTTATEHTFNSADSIASGDANQNLSPLNSSVIKIQPAYLHIN